jgi:Malectin domain
VSSRLHFLWFFGPPFVLTNEPAIFFFSSFAEIFYNTTGSRIFGLVVEDQVIPEFDIVQLAGAAFIPTMKEISTVLVSDGFLSIAATQYIEHPKISAMEVHWTGPDDNAALSGDSRPLTSPEVVDVPDLQVNPVVSTPVVVPVPSPLHNQSATTTTTTTTSDNNTPSPPSPAIAASTVTVTTNNNHAVGASTRANDTAGSGPADPSSSGGYVVSLCLVISVVASVAFGIVL